MSIVFGNGKNVDLKDSKSVYMFFKEQLANAEDIISLRSISNIMADITIYIPNHISSMMYDMYELHLLHIMDKEKNNGLSHAKTYIFRNSLTGLYKIGMTRQKDVGTRLKQTSSHGGSNSIILVINKNIENELHKRFKTKREGGEWFSLNESDIKEVRLLGHEDINPKLF